MGYKTCKTCHICIQCQNVNTLRQFDLTNLLSAESRVTQPYKSPSVSSVWKIWSTESNVYIWRTWLSDSCRKQNHIFTFGKAWLNWQSHFWRHPSPSLSTELQNRNMTTRYIAEACKIAGLYLDLYCTCLIRNTCEPDILFCLGNLTQVQLTQNATALCKY